MGEFRPSRPGERRGGRQAGTPNKSTGLLKDAILKAATDAGDGDLSAYLLQQARTNPGPFMSLLGKVLPLQTQGEVGGKLIVEWAKEPITDA